MFKDIMPIQCVSDVCNLNPPLSSKTDTSLPLIAFYMNLMKVEAAAIVDEHNHCIGFVTSDDVVNHTCDQKKNGQNPCIADVMRPPNMAVYSNDPIDQAELIMNLHKIDWLPVIDFNTNRFSGLICRNDIDAIPTNIIAFSKRKFSVEKAI